MNYAHTSIFVSDLEKSIQFYEEIVGLKIVQKLDSPENAIAFLANDANSTKIELICNGKETFSGKGLLLGFDVDDVVAYREKLDTMGLHPSPMVFPHPGVQFFFVNDPNGVTIQFVGESN